MKRSTVVFGCVFLVLLLASGIELTYGTPKEAAKKPLAGYNLVVVEKFIIDKNPSTEEFPKGQEMVIQSDTVGRLRKLKLFEEVIDATEAPAPEATNPAAPQAEVKAVTAPAKRRVLLGGSVITYDKGSRAGRWLVGFGAGATKVKVRFIFRDAETGAEVFRTDRQGKFYGTISLVGGGKEHAVSEAAGDVVDGLIRDIQKNR